MPEMFIDERWCFDSCFSGWDYPRAVWDDQELQVWGREVTLWIFHPSSETKVLSALCKKQINYLLDINYYWLEKIFVNIYCKFADVFTGPGLASFT